MLLGKVIGTLVSSQKIEAFSGVKFLIVQPLDENLEPKGTPIVACDSQQAGPGQIVTYIGGREASLPLPVPFNPADATITSIVDAVENNEGRRTTVPCPPPASKGLGRGTKNKKAEGRRQKSEGRSR